jgi:hypothetical protein
MNSHFHFLTTVKLETSHILLQQQGVILKHDNAAPHSTHWTQLLQPFQWEFGNIHPTLQADESTVQMMPIPQQ